jgi:DNA topoisomerase-1
VTAGRVNASPRRGDDPETITPERAAELIQARREAGPSTRGRGVKKAGGAKKVAGAKKAGAAQKPGGTNKAVAKKAPGPS